ncbi:hypothetical protein RTBOTA2_001793 [Rhodotorula toruloides]|nr:hypothetical protein RTBOTA2_001793 [Rhodotorula toruloides]
MGSLEVVERRRSVIQRGRNSTRLNASTMPADNEEQENLLGCLKSADLRTLPFCDWCLMRRAPTPASTSASSRTLLLLVERGIDAQTRPTFIAAPLFPLPPQASSTRPSTTISTMHCARVERRIAKNPSLGSSRPSSLTSGLLGLTDLDAPSPSADESRYAGGGGGRRRGIFVLFCSSSWSGGIE